MNEIFEDCDIRNAFSDNNKHFKKNKYLSGSLVDPLLQMARLPLSFLLSSTLVVHCGGLHRVSLSPRLFHYRFQ